MQTVVGVRSTMNKSLTLSGGLTPAPVSIFPVAGCRVLRTELIIDEEIPYDQWEQIGEFLCKLDDGVQWWLGDWLNYGERTYGETYAQVVDATGYRAETLWNAAYIAGQFESSSREEDLSWSHHKAVVGLDPQDRRDLLKRAKDEQWSSKDTERRARARKTFKEIERRPDTLWTVNQQMAEEWLLVRERVRSFAEKYPQTTSPTDSYIEEIEYILKEGAKTDFNEILLYWIREGYQSVEAIAQATKKERTLIKVALENLVEAGTLRTIQQGGKTDVARGAAITLYLINYAPDGEVAVTEEDDED